MNGGTVVFVSDYAMRANGYDVLEAFCGSATQCLSAARQPRSGMVEDLLEESLAALAHALPRLTLELLNGTVIGRHGSQRRLTPATRFYLCEGGVREVDREGWRFRAQRIVQGAGELRRVEATTRFSARFSFEALRHSVDAAFFARELANFIAARLRSAANPTIEISSVIGDLMELGHPLVGYEARHENDRALDVFGYLPSASLRFGLMFEVFIDTSTDAPEIEVRVGVTNSGSPPPPGFPG